MPDDVYRTGHFSPSASFVHVLFCVVFEEDPYTLLSIGQGKASNSVSVHKLPFNLLSLKGIILYVTSSLNIKQKRKKITIIITFTSETLLTNSLI